MHLSVEEYLLRLDAALSTLERAAAGESGSILNQAAAMTPEAAEAIDPEVRAHLAWAFSTAAEAERRARELWGIATTHPGLPSYATPGEMAVAGLPFNRKERFYTGTVLPQIIGCADFTHLHRFLSLCGIEGLVFGSRSPVLQFFTEYGYNESIVSPGARLRFGEFGRRDTPDVILHMTWPISVLLGVEAKMYDRVDSFRLGEQLRYQRLLLKHIATGLELPLDQVHHVALLPTQLAEKIGDLAVPVVTWQQVLAEFGDVAPPYWLDVLDHALTQYDILVSKYSGPNADFQLAGHTLVAQFRAGALQDAWMGRKGGLQVATKDVSEGSWYERTYECRLEALLGNPNWFPVSAFADAVEAKWPPLGPAFPQGTLVRGRPSGWNSPNRAEAGPSLEGYPEWIEGPLEGFAVEHPERGIWYFKHIVNGIDVDPDTLERQ
jgi:hypothetical protein